MQVTATEKWGMPVLMQRDPPEPRYEPLQKDRLGQDHRDGVPKDVVQAPPDYCQRQNQWKLYGVGCE